ncbi:hypothetical protein MKX03_021040, partial [Papaver bracteatum]
GLCHFDPDVSKGLANGYLLPKDCQAYVQITDRAKIMGICNMNMFHLLSSLDRANQILKFSIAERDNVIRAALSNRDLEIKCLCSKIAFKDLEIQDLKDD